MYDAPASSPGDSGRKLKLRRLASLKLERSSWIDHWREISTYMQPRLGRFLVTDVNKGGKRHQQIYDGSAGGASKILGAGLLSGMTSPARPWFRLSLVDKELMKAAAVKSWLHQVEGLMRDVFTHSNTYRALHMLYEELGLFGTGTSIMVEDFDNVVHHHPLTVGEYMMATDSRGYVNTLAREYKMTVAQIAEKWGTASMCESTRHMFDRRQLDAWVDVAHIIEPRVQRDPNKVDNKNMAFASCYLELNAPADEDKYLSESGFEKFPALAARWHVTGNDVYGSSPGMDALGDVKQLQHQQLRKSQAIDLKVNPPLQVPTQFKDAAQHRLPGGTMYVDATGPGQGVRSAYEVNLDLSHLLGDITDVRNRIRSAFYADLFMMLANDTRSGTTATEISQRHEEKLLMLGPVLERLHNELLQPLIDNTFDRCSKAGILPPPPKELQGQHLNVEFISTLAQAQRMVSASGTDRLLGTVGTLAQLFPQVLDKIDADQVIDDYADMFGVNPEVIVPEDVVEAKREAKAKAAAAQAAMANAQAAAETMKTASEANGGQPGAPGQMQDVMNSVQGYSTPGATAV